MKATNAQMIETILKSGICLHTVWGRSFELARMAEKLPESVRKAGQAYGYRYHSVLPTSAQTALEEAYQRASEVLAANARRRAFWRASGHVS